MSQLLTLNKNSFNEFYQSMRNRFSVENINELAVKAMAVVILNKAPLNSQEEIKLAVENIEKKYSDIFTQNGHAILSQHLSTPMLNLIMDLSDSQQKGLLTQQNKQEWLQYLFTLQLNAVPSGFADNFAFEETVYTLCNTLFSEVEGEVYLPSANSIYHSLMLASHQSVIAEGIRPSVMPELLNIILGNIQYKQSDAALNPAYIQAGQLTPFKKGFLAEPWGLKTNLDEEAKRRFAVMSNNYQNYLIQHLCQQVQDFAIVAVPMSNLFSSVKSEVEMRKWLVEQAHIKAIISFPNNFVKTASVAFSLIIFDFREKQREINFISLKDSAFIEKQLRENKLINIDLLVEIINGKPDAISRKINIEDLATEGYMLDPERYVVDSQTAAALDILNQYETCALGNLVEILRPITSLPKEEGDHAIFEVQGGDIPEYGYIDNIGKEYQLEENCKHQLEKYYLQENDILMTIRGTTGKVGIISKSLLEQCGGRIIAGKTCVVLRLQKNVEIQPLALLMQLRSEFSQARLQRLSSGAVIAGLSVKDLKEFPIVLFSFAKQQELAEKFNQQDKIKQMIRQQEQELKALANNFWQTK